MLLDQADREPTLAEQVQSRILRSTYGRIRNLSVQEIQGRFVVCGSVSTHHTKQLALQGMLEMLSGDRFHAKIVVD